MDDDSSIHRIWDGRLESARVHESRITIYHLSTPDQLRHWIREHPPIQKSLLLLDFELLGFSETGLDLIESLKIQEQAILVTSRFEEAQVRAKCERLGVRLIPKPMAAYVPIEVVSAQLCPDAILVDDDPLVHATWRMAATASGKSIEMFLSPEEFLAKASSFASHVPLYLDVSFPGGIRGETIASQAHAMGFTHIWLATGYTTQSISRPSFVRGVIGKDPPF